MVKSFKRVSAVLVATAIAGGVTNASADQNGSCGTIENATVGGMNYHSGLGGWNDSWYIYKFDNLHGSDSYGWANESPYESNGFHQSACGS